MGTTQSYLSPEIVVTAAVVAGAVGFGYKQAVSVSASSPEPEVPAPSSKQEVGGKKKGKNKKLGTSLDTSTTSVQPTPNVVAFPDVIPGQFDDTASDNAAAASESVKVKKGKKKKGGKSTVDDAKAETVTELVAPAAAAELLASSSVSQSSSKSKKKKQQPASTPKPSNSAGAGSQLQQSTVSLASLATESDGDWTRVSRSAGKGQKVHASGAMSDLGHSTSITTGTSSPVDTRTEEGEEEDEDAIIESGSGERNLLAKKLTAKPRKTGVEDMLATSDYPSYSRVMRVQSEDQSTAGATGAEYEDFTGGDNPAGGELDGDGGTDADGEDEGWGVVKRSGRPKNKPLSIQQSSSAGRTASASETLTKRQRQNAAKREVEKSAKAEAERQRLATLTQHRRQQETARIEAQYAQGAKKAVSGGMKMTANEKGKLVWE